MTKKREEVLKNWKESLHKVEMIAMAIESEDFKQFTLTTRYVTMIMTCHFMHVCVAQFTTNHTFSIFFGNAVLLFFLVLACTLLSKLLICLLSPILVDPLCLCHHRS